MMTTSSPAFATCFIGPERSGSIIHKVGSSIVPQPRRSPQAAVSRLAGTRLLVVDSDEAIRRSAHHLLGVQGAVVETARDGHEAIALMRQTPYSAALVDIRLPDLDGYEIFHRLHEVQPQTPVILMTGFGYDPTHSIVKARQEGLQTVLYKPFRSDRLMEAVEQALRVVSSGSASDGSALEDAARKSAPQPPPAAPIPFATSATGGGEGQPGAPSPSASASAVTDGVHEESRPTEVLRHEP